MVIVHRFRVTLAAEFGHCDVTSEIRDWIAASPVRNGILSVQLVGSTGAVTTIEYESGALQDLERAVERLAPARGDYAHNERWGDANGFSHVRSALLKTGIALPVVDGEIQLGTWQQIVAINFDNRERTRELVAVVVGE
jgi:secondary thiamine-phosphate synthase enzyme